MKKFLTIALILATLCTLCGCTHKIAGNYPQYCYCDFVQTENGFWVYGYEVSLTDKTYKENTDEFPLSENYLDGGTAPRYCINAPQGYEGVVKHIETQALDTERSVVDTCGYISDGKLYGFVNVYKDTVGYFAGGGNYGMEEISHGIVFEYLPQTDTFTQPQRFDGCNIVAYSNNIVLYWKNKNYYSYDLATQTETFLVADKAYDSGFQHQSWSTICTNNQYTLFIMNKARGATDTEYAYLYNYSTMEFCSLCPID